MVEARAVAVDCADRVPPTGLRLADAPGASVWTPSADASGHATSRRRCHPTRRRGLRSTSHSHAPLRRRDFRNLWLGQMVSTIGAEIAVVAVPFQVYKLTGSTALVGLLGLASLVPLLVRPARRRRDRGRARPADRRPRHRDRDRRSSPACSSLNALLPHPQVWALFVLQGLAVAVYSLGRPALASLAPRLVPDEELAAANSLSSVYSSLVERRRAGGRRRDHRDRRRAVDVRDRRGHVRRVAARDLVAAEAAAARRGRPAELPRDRRRLPVPEGTAGADRDLRDRHERDGVRHAERALPGDRAAPAARNGVDGRLPLRGAVRRRARLLAPLRLELARPAAGARDHGDGVSLGRRDRGLRLHDVARAGARCCSPSRAAPTSTAPCSGARCCSDRRPTTCAAACSASSSRRWRARRASATSRRACSRR